MNIFSETHAFFPPGEDYSYVERRVCRSGVGNLAKVKTPRPLLLMASTESAAAAVVVEVPSRSLNGQFSKSALPKKQPSQLAASSLPSFDATQGSYFSWCRADPPTERPYRVSI